VAHHHIPAFIDAIDADRRRARRATPADSGEIERMMLAAAGRDEAAWTSLIRRFSRAVRGVARAQRLSAHDADDIEQTTWLRLLEHIHQINQPVAVGAWLRTTARREGLKALQAGMREQPTDHELHSTPNDMVDEGALDQRLRRAERSGAVLAALQALPQRERMMMAMLFAEPALSYAEIADALDMPVGSIGPTRARCLERLRADGRLTRTVTPDG
jgi:RNA polymerase sigma factor (sigma-70 family)